MSEVSVLQSGERGRVVVVNGGADRFPGPVKPATKGGGQRQSRRRAMAPCIGRSNLKKGIIQTWRRPIRPWRCGRAELYRGPTSSRSRQARKLMT